MKAGQPEPFMYRWSRLAEGEFGDFLDIPAADRPSPSPFLCGLLKLAALTKAPADFRVYAENPGGYTLNVSRTDELFGLSDDDIVYLARCKFFAAPADEDEPLGGEADILYRTE